MLDLTSSCNVKVLNSSCDLHVTHSKNDLIERRKLARRLIDDIYDNGPAGLLHLRLLSRILGCKIQVWIGNRQIRSFGRSSARPIDIEYRSNRANRLGHWCLKGGREPECHAVGNSCLYAVIASQIGWDAAELRRKTAAALRRERLDALLRDTSGVCALMGGASYNGDSPSSAGRLLDESQKGQAHPDGGPGHPRGHASNPHGLGSTDSVEAYSHGRWRSGFMSRDDQDLVAHYSLITDQAESLMDRLNHGGIKEDAHIGRNSIDYDELPLCSIWDKGEMQGSPRHLGKVVLVGKHFYGKQNDAEAPVFILTFYPVV